MLMLSPELRRAGRARGSRRRQLGFTLIEVLVAFAIAALALSLLVKGAIGGLRAASVAGRYEEALSHARSHLSAIGGALTPMDTQGDEGEVRGIHDQGVYHWRVRVSPLASVMRGGGVIGGSPGVRTILYRVQVAISWQEGHRNRAVELETKRLGVTVTAAPRGGMP